MPNSTPNSTPNSPTPPQKLMMTQTLRKTPMFAGISEEALQSLIDGCHLQTISKGHFLFHEGEPAHGFYVVHTGAVNVHRVTEDGREQVLRVFYPGESLGEVVIVGDKSYPASAKSIENGQVILIPTQFFRQQIQTDPDLALRILASMSSHLRFLVETIEGLKLQQAESRVIQWLLRQLDPSQENAHHPQITLPLAKHLLASQLGITSETLSRVFARLKTLNALNIDGKTITFLDLPKLKNLLLTAN